ncbi:uncharacterized protein DDB_G0283697-like [Papaver somniferum]|uniref:uncharacterized protein DDB_G0283697-like n=1 Tax=Papaver somniferum TaxID=3469 RepID=UPI000E6FDBD2|nr:uncharacterized protein DDB_G0283697-like [Papaver somniferum]
MKENCSINDDDPIRCVRKVGFGRCRNDKCIGMEFCKSHRHHATKESNHVDEENKEENDEEEEDSENENQNTSDEGEVNSDVESENVKNTDEEDSQNENENTSDDDEENSEESTSDDGGQILKKRKMSREVDALKEAGNDEQPRLKRRNKSKRENLNENLITKQYKVSEDQSDAEVDDKRKKKVSKVSSKPVVSGISGSKKRRRFLQKLKYRMD